jgi:prepilin-type N-terminal cleavage/methylation domain-containing protein
MHHAVAQARRRAFTLIEILIVVTILGILASIVIVNISSSTEQAQRSSFAAAGRVLVEASMRYKFDTGEWPEDSGSGFVPTGLEPYIVEQQWLLGTPIGGVWDSEYNAFGIVSAVGVHFDGTGDTHDDAYMLSIDTRIDDGNLSTGGFRKIADARYYFICMD